MATLKDVAKLAGVSTITVSRVLNGSYYVSEATKHKVMAAVEQLNYKPNAIARSLRNARTSTIGVLVPDISNPYFMSLIRSLEAEVQREGYHILLASSDDDPAKEAEMLDVLEMRVDAMVVASSFSTASAPLLDRDVPIILVDRKVEGAHFSSVIEECEKSSYELVKHLIQFGHRDIAILNSSAEISTAQSRQQGYERALSQFGIEPNPNFVCRGQLTKEWGYLMCKRLFSAGEPQPTAIFCANNSLTQGALLAIRELGLAVPDDVSLVSFGDLPLSELIEPRITAVIQNPENVGKKTSEILLKELGRGKDEGGCVEALVLPTHIRLGESVRPLY
ncbi:LacI family DNA-binding transcriptional regulator [Alicyclobacillus acidiphilus]|uniref:LacI family DNA-binding transcriptional regulator n=1 Tax=Alicyclobacillus acidiphilus TaxID=182455 RepID=UPI00083128C2|nr:LacI family DNA-binding transcriptional regulator [Alicyclobacillus acidiphilus]